MFTPSSALCIFWPEVTVHCLEIRFEDITEEGNGRSMLKKNLSQGKGKSTLRRIFSRFCTPIFLEVCLLPFLITCGRQELPLHVFSCGSEEVLCVLVYIDAVEHSKTW
ncbi:hypothetical protein BHE74_00012391 [Ensete ventricosum]|nr:hypothetical protein GW17_00011558 [Ensete ventricosum]RWW79335.1 hypothetical protein BHE74_00012391 [Ensete ventricosum]